MEQAYLSSLRVLYLSAKPQAVLDPLIAPLLREGNSLELRLLGLCIYIDVLEYGGRIGAAVAPAVLPLALEVR